MPFFFPLLFICVLVILWLLDTYVCTKHILAIRSAAFWLVLVRWSVVTYQVIHGLGTRLKCMMKSRRLWPRVINPGVYPLVIKLMVIRSGRRHRMWRTWGGLECQLLDRLMCPVAILVGGPTIRAYCREWNAIIWSMATWAIAASRCRIRAARRR